MDPVNGYGSVTFADVLVILTGSQGVGIAFGPDVTRRWCTLNGVAGIIRSHEVRQDGYAVEHDGLCTTVSLEFSAHQVLLNPNHDPGVLCSQLR